MSTLKTDTISEKTTDNGVAIDTFKLKDSVMISSNTVASGTISSSENAMVAMRNLLEPATYAKNLATLANETS